MEDAFFMGLSITVLDDNPFYATLLEHQLMNEIRTNYKDHAQHFKVQSYTDHTNFIKDLPATQSVLLVDYYLGNGMTGVDLMSQIKRAAPNSKVIIMTSENNLHVLPSCIETGASGFVLKDNSTVDLCRMIIHDTINSSTFPYKFLF